MRCAILGFVIGAAWLQTQAALPSWLLIAVLLLCAALLVYGARRAASWPMPDAHRAPRLGCLLHLAAGVAVGFAWAALFAMHYLQEELPARWEGRDVTVIGTIDSLPNHIEQGVRFNFKVEQVMPVEGELPVLPSTLALAWYSAFRAQELQAVGDVQPGERWQLTVRLKRPHGSANPHGFDYEVWLLEQNLRATGYVRPDDKAAAKNQRLTPFVVSPGNIVERSRGWLRERIYAALPDKKYAGVLVALVIGDQRAVSQSDWKVFNRTGIGHLVSISGLHVTMVAGLFASLVLALWRRSFFTGAQLPLLVPAPKAAVLAGVLMALVYVLLAGFGVPAQRTLYMLSVVALAYWLNRLTSMTHVLSLALGVVVLLDPWAVLAPGFWLSFGAVALILYASSGRIEMEGEWPRSARWQRQLKSAAHTQMVITFGLVPLTMLLFGQISLVSPVANAIAIPLISLIVTPLALLGSLLPAPLSGWLLGLGHFLVETLAGVLEWMSAWPGAVWRAPLPAWWAFALALAGTVWLLAPRGWPSRWLGVAGWLPLLLNVPTHPPAGQMWVTAFDVGQGMALLVETRHHRLLYDSGPFYSPESDGGNRVLTPYLKARGIGAIDAMVVTHTDNDHSGGALSVMQEIEVGWVSSSLWLDHPIVAAAPRHSRCKAGQQWDWDGVHFEMLHPGADSYENARWKPNARSCTLKITLANQGGEGATPLSILLPGDIEAAQEAQLLNADQDKLRATVLLAPHHGSGTSSTQAFLETVQPQLALFQVGYRNRYGHPKAQVYERYGNLGITRLRSDDSGAISLQFGKALMYSTYRTEHARYWHGR